MIEAFVSELFDEICYVVTTPSGKHIAIDPGQGVASMLRARDIHIDMVLNTHGHYDHVWDNALLDAPIYIHQDDEFMLSDPFGKGHTPSVATRTMQNAQSIECDGLEFVFWHFAGHTPGCCMIEIKGANVAFSGDFIFDGCIGRYDFAYSSGAKMKESLARVLEIDRDLTLYPGHGGPTTLNAQRDMIRYFYHRLSKQYS